VQAFHDMTALREAARTGGVRSSLAILNARVLHRYTAIYQLREDTLYCAYLYDKTQAVNADFLQAVPLGDSFCQFVFRDGLFLVDDSASDKRLDGHPYQGVVMAYHALPLLDNRGELYGTLCHLDLERRELPAGELEYLQKAARLIAGCVVSEAATQA